MNRAIRIGRTVVFAALICLPPFTFAAPPTTKPFEKERERLVTEDIIGAGIKDKRVIESVRSTLRHEFMPADQRKDAYFDMALPIGEGQTISPPYVVAYMTEQLEPQPTDTVLEIGTGSGYQAAILSPLVKEVYSIEIVKPLGERAARTLKRLGYKNVFTKVGDGYQGWPEHAPFDKIIVTCSPEKVPPKLVEQLREGGRMIVPVGERYRQTLHLFTKQDGKLSNIALLPTLFVPMTGKAESQREKLPDPLHPQIQNGGFEELIEIHETASDVDAKQAEAKPLPVGWHYQRQMRLTENDGAPEGKNFVTFSNGVPGRMALALQGMAVDGHKVPRIELSTWVRANRIRPGLTQFEQATIYVFFYDENRNEASHQLTCLDPWNGSFDWKQVKETFDVPPHAREAIIRIGLHGATGEVSFDDIRITAVKKK